MILAVNVTANCHEHRLYDTAGVEVKHNLCIGKDSLVYVNSAGEKVSVLSELVKVKSREIEYCHQDAVVHASEYVAQLVWKYISSSGYADLTLHEWLDKMMGDDHGA